MEEGKFSKLTPKEQEILAQLKKHQYSDGAHYDSLRVSDFGNGYRGVVSTNPIKQGQIIVFIPKEHLITLEMAISDPICQELIQKHVQVISPKHTYLSIFLLQEYLKLQKSKWKLYLDLLPKDHSNFPINYSTQELKELVGSPFLMQIHEKVYDLKKDYDLLCQASEEFRKYKFRDFCWARTMVGSRIFGLLINKVKTDILAPFADMLNHRIPRQTSWNYSEEKQGFIIESLQDIPQGVEVFDSYGKKCNSRYLLNYAFVIEGNMENQVCLKTSIDGDLKTKKLQMLMKPEGFTKVIKVSVNLNESCFYEAMGFLRFKVITDINHLNVLEKISGIKISKIPYVPAKTPPINLDVQIKIWLIIRSLCSKALQEYHTSIEKDKQLLQNKKLPQTLRNIFILRSGQKAILHKIIEYSAQVIAIFTKGYVKTCEHIQKHQDQPWSKYMLKILSIMPGEKSKILRERMEVEPEGRESEDNEEESTNN